MLPTVILPGYLASYQDYQVLAQSLNQEGLPTVIVPLRKRDWIPTLGGRSIVPILQKVDRTVQETLHSFQTNKVNLVGHSAGGWIARIYLGDIPYTIHGDVTPKDATWGAHRWVSTLITLGTPHTSQERWTRKNLTFVNDNYPDAFYDHIQYVCVAGKSKFGKKDWQNWLAYNSYELTCGYPETWGDGITPIESAHLQGAINLTLEGVSHSIRSTVWYGSPHIYPQWIKYLLDK